MCRFETKMISPCALPALERFRRRVRLTTVRHFRLWTRQCNCRVLLKRAGATPHTFWAAESRKSGVAPARFGSFLAVAFGVSLRASHFFSGECAPIWVKTLVQDEVQSENVTFFTARGPVMSWVNGPGTALDEAMCDHSLISHGDYSTDETFRWESSTMRKIEQARHDNLLLTDNLAEPLRHFSREKLTLSIWLGACFLSDSEGRHGSG